jgi:hypothetical protein
MLLLGMTLIITVSFAVWLLTKFKPSEAPNNDDGNSFLDKRGSHMFCHDADDIQASINSCKQRELVSLPNSAVITNHYLRSVGQSSSRAAYVPD